MSVSNIVPSLSPEELIRLFRKEAKIAANGSVTFTRRGVSRLTDKSKDSLLRLFLKIKGGAVLGKIVHSETLEFAQGSSFSGGAILNKKTKYAKPLSKPLMPFSGMDFTGNEGIPEVLVSAILAHYDKLGSTRCEDLRLIFDSVGLRQSVHTAQNWEANQSQADRVAYRYLLAEPRNWDKQFPDEFYSQLERLTGISLTGSNRPHYWANLTNELVYDHLPREIADGVRNAKTANDGMDKLHQYLSPDGLDMLKKHLEVLMHLMSGAGSIEEVRSMAIRSFRGEYQLKLSLN